MLYISNEMQTTTTTTITTTTTTTEVEIKVTPSTLYKTYIRLGGWYKTQNIETEN